MTRTRIVATLGPATEKAEVLGRMAAAGMDVARINFSHGTVDEHLRHVALVGRLNKKLRHPLKIIGDLEGFRIRIGNLVSPREIQEGERLIMKKGAKAPAGYVPFDFGGDLGPIVPGKHIFVDDGNLELVVETRSAETLTTRVVRGGLLKERKGVNIPGVSLVFDGLSAKDRLHIDFCLEHRFDFIAQSFVRDAGDVRQIRSRTGSSHVRIIAKIENSEGIRRIESIIGASDGIMIARGDMGISIPIYKVPFVQKQIIRACRRSGRFSVTATQMLESMTRSMLPTRAEVSDVANAVLDGSDYVMLSAETSVGKFPVEAVRMMQQIVTYAETFTGAKRKQ